LSFETLTLLWRYLAQYPSPSLIHLFLLGSGGSRLELGDMKNETETKSIPIKLDWVRRITMNPWVEEPFLGSVRSSIQAIDGCRAMKVSPTTMLENERWKRIARNAERK